MNAFFRPPPRVAPPAPAESRLRTLLIGARLLTYTLKRSARRTIGFVISRRGLAVTAPQRISLQAIESAIIGKHRWIFAKLDDWVDHTRPPEDAPREWRDGAQIALYGEAVTLRLCVADGARAKVDYDAATRLLRVALPATPPAPHAGSSAQMTSGASRDSAGLENSAPSATPAPQCSPADNARIGVLLQAWFQGEARRRFAERLALHAPRVGVRFKAFALSSAKTRWGSCTSAGNIRLNWRLVHFPLDVLDYVVIHELAHLREMNHSPRFWAVVEGVMPDYQRLRALLKQPAAGALPRL
ncbi:MAG: M48 family metallopeptidase [Janthinobacterium lividum]